MNYAERLSAIETCSLLDVTRYHRAIWAYVAVLLRPDCEGADDVAQEIVAEMLRGGMTLKWLRSARQRPFRMFLKTATYWAAMNYRKEKQRLGSRLDWHIDLLPATEPPTERDADSAWEGECDRADAEIKRQVCEIALKRLEEFQNDHEKNVFFTLATLRKAHPTAKTSELANFLLERTGRNYTEPNIRQQMDRMRERFAEFLWNAAKACMTPAELAELVERDTFEERLKDLRLMGYL